MNKRKGVLDAARKSNSVINDISVEKARLQIVIEVMARYYEIYDMDNGTIHSKVFSMLYRSSIFYTYKDICKTLSISKNTLIRYVSKYDELAKKVLKRLKL